MYFAKVLLILNWLKNEQRKLLKSMRIGRTRQIRTADLYHVKVAL